MNIFLKNCIVNKTNLEIYFNNKALKKQVNNSFIVIAVRYRVMPIEIVSFKNRVRE